MTADVVVAGGDSWKWQLRDSKGKWVEMGAKVKWMAQGAQKSGEVVGSPKPGVATVKEDRTKQRENIASSRLTVYDMGSYVKGQIQKSAAEEDATQATPRKRVRKPPPVPVKRGETVAMISRFRPPPKPLRADGDPVVAACKPKKKRKPMTASSMEARIKAAEVRATLTASATRMQAQIARHEISK